MESFAAENGLSKEQLRSFETKFRVMSKNKPGIPKEEFHSGISELGLELCPEFANRVFESAVPAGETKMDFERFVLYFGKLCSRKLEDNAQISYGFIDPFQTGSFRREDLQSFILLLYNSRFNTTVLSMTSKGQTQQQVMKKELIENSNELFKILSEDGEEVSKDQFTQKYLESKEVRGIFHNIGKGLAFVAKDPMERKQNKIYEAFVFFQESLDNIEKEARKFVLNNQVPQEVKIQKEKKRLGSLSQLAQDFYHKVNRSDSHGKMSKERASSCFKKEQESKDPFEKVEVKEVGWVHEPSSNESDGKKIMSANQKYRSAEVKKGNYFSNKSNNNLPISISEKSEEEISKINEDQENDMVFGLKSTSPKNSFETNKNTGNFNSQQIQEPKTTKPKPKKQDSAFFVNPCEPDSAGSDIDFEYERNQTEKSSDMVKSASEIVSVPLNIIIKSQKTSGRSMLKAVKSVKSSWRSKGSSNKSFGSFASGQKALTRSASINQRAKSFSEKDTLLSMQKKKEKITRRKTHGFLNDEPILIEKIEELKNIAQETRESLFPQLVAGKTSLVFCQARPNSFKMQPIDQTYTIPVLKGLLLALNNAEINVSLSNLFFYRQKCTYSLQIKFKTAKKPQNKVIYTFHDYSPSIFANIRLLFGISNKDYLESIGNIKDLQDTGKASVTPKSIKKSSFTKQNKSGKTEKLFFYSSDKNFLFKSISTSEFSFIRKFLMDYTHYMVKNNDSFLNPIVGMHKLTQKSKKDPVYWIVIKRMAIKELQNHKTYDLFPRHPKKQKKQPKPTKEKEESDLSCEIEESVVDLGDDEKQLILSRLKDDSIFLAQKGISEYSLRVRACRVSDGQFLGECNIHFTMTQI